MTVQGIESDFRKKVCEKLQLISEGIGRYRIHTPFSFDDGDHIVAVLKKENGHWLITDEGHTFMHLTYDLDEKSLYTGRRQKIITDALSMFFVEDREGELAIKIEEDKYGDALYNFIQAVLKISDVAYLKREQVRSTFLDEFHNFIEQNVREERRTFDWNDKNLDPDGKYSVDCRINSVEKPLFVFALQNDDKVRDTTISLHQYEKWEVPFRSLAIFEDQQQINRRVLARFTDICEKQYSSLSTNKDRIAKYLKEIMGE